MDVSPPNTYTKLFNQNTPVSGGQKEFLPKQKLLLTTAHRRWSRGRWSEDRTPHHHHHQRHHQISNLVVIADKDGSGVPLRRPISHFGCSTQPQVRELSQNLRSPTSMCCWRDSTPPTPPRAAQGTRAASSRPPALVLAPTQVARGRAGGLEASESSRTLQPSCKTNFKKIQVHK